MTTTTDVLLALAAELQALSPRPPRRRSRRHIPRRVSTLRPAEIVRRAGPQALQMQAEGMTRREIAERLNETGPPPVGGIWTVRAVERLLSSARRAAAAEAVA